jgi:hypothetical protein
VKTTYEEHEVIRVVADGAISESRTHDGRLVTVLFLDCSRHPHFEDVIRLHPKTSSGDVISTWATTKSQSLTLGLHLNFIRPISCEAMVLFEMPKHVYIIDSIIRNRACYIQSSKYGTKLAYTFNGTPRILLEIPSNGMPLDWDELADRIIYNRFREEGLSRPQAKGAAKGFWKEIRAKYHFRRSL